MGARALAEALVDDVEVLIAVDVDDSRAPMLEAVERERVLLAKAARAVPRLPGTTSPLSDPERRPQRDAVGTGGAPDRSIAAVAQHGRANHRLTRGEPT